MIDHIRAASVEWRWIALVAVFFALCLAATAYAIVKAQASESRHAAWMRAHCTLRSVEVRSLGIGSGRIACYDCDDGVSRCE